MKAADRRRGRTTPTHPALLLSCLIIYRDGHGRFASAFPSTFNSRGASRLFSTSTKQIRNNGKIISSATDASHQKANGLLGDSARKKPNFSILPDFMSKDPTLLTDKRILQQKLDAMKEAEFSTQSNQSSMEMMAMSAVSIALAVSVVYSLASSTPDVSTFTDGLTGISEGESEIKGLLLDGSERGMGVSRLGIATRNVAMTVLPQSADDVIAVSIGEGIAGAIGAVATWLLGMVLRLRGGGLNEFLELSEKEREKTMMRESLFSGAVADGDYFLTRAAAQPLLEAAGLPIFLASLVSVLVATVPYEAIKLSSQKQMEQEKEKALLDMLLQEEELRQRNFSIVDKFSIGMAEFFDRLNVRAQYDDDENEFSDEALQRALMEEQQQRIQEVKDSAPKVDGIELFADITKWLEYDVLINNYRGILALPDGTLIGPGWESAVFGFMAALSSQLYTDVLYIYSDFGNPEKREKTLNRPLELWASIYTSKCLSAATLFGTYEALRAPISRFCAQVITGAYSGCIGSEDYELCQEAYMLENPTEASFMEVFKAFFTSLMNWIDSLVSFLPLNEQDNLVSLAGSEVIAMYIDLDKFLST
ncbi:hypothetical protein ACHAXN_006532 [Cyclotella atomus]